MCGTKKRQILYLSLFLSLLFLLSPPLKAYQGNLQIEALYLDFFPHEGRLLGISQVVLTIEEYTIEADWMEILFYEGLLRARGEILIKGKEIIGGDELEFSLTTMEGTIRGGDLRAKDFRLEALQWDYSLDTIVLWDSYYTPCPPGYEEFYFTAKRLELTEEMKLLAYGVDFYLFSERVFSLPYYSGWIRQGRFYPSTPIPAPGYNARHGFYVNLYYHHYVDEETKGEYTLLLSQVEPSLMVDYRREGAFYGGLRLKEKREGLFFQYSRLERIDVELTLQRGENFFLSEEEKKVITYWPSLSLRSKPLLLLHPLSLSLGLGFAMIREGEGESISCGSGSFLLQLERVSLQDLSYEGDLRGVYRLYSTEDLLLEYGLDHALHWNHSLFQGVFGHRLLGYKGTTPLLFHHPLQGVSMEGHRSYYELSLHGDKGDFHWDLGAGLVKYPTGKNYQYHSLELGSMYRPLKGLLLTGDYHYQEARGEALLEEDERTLWNHLRPGLLLSLTPTHRTTMDLSLRGDYSLEDEIFESVTLGVGTSFRESADRFQFHLRTSYDIVQKRWGEEGLKVEMIFKSKDQIHYQMALQGYPTQEEALLTLRRESPCLYLELKVQISEPSLEISMGTNF